MTRVAVNPDLLNWAAGRARIDEPTLARRFPKWPEWLSGEVQPTLRQLETFARLTHIPFGYFFLPEPPAVNLPVPDFRTMRDIALEEPSTELLDTIYLCQQRQDWFREHANLYGLPWVAWVGSLSTDLPIERASALMREWLDISINARRQLSTWTDALRQLIEQAEQAGVLVMASSIGAPDLPERERQQGGADVHARPRAGASRSGRERRFGFPGRCRARTCCRAMVQPGRC